MLLWQEQDISLGFFRTGFKVPAAGDLQLGGFVPAENMQVSGQDAVGMEWEIAQCREVQQQCWMQSAPRKGRTGKSDEFRACGASWAHTNLLHHLCTVGLRHPGCIQCIHHMLLVELEGGQGWTVGFGDAVSTLQEPLRECTWTAETFPRVPGNCEETWLLPKFCISGRDGRRLIRNCFIDSSAKISGGTITREEFVLSEVWQWVLAQTGTFSL